MSVAVASAPLRPLRTLVVGDQGAFVQNGFGDFLKRYGFDPEWTWAGDTEKASVVMSRIPQVCEAVVMLFEMQRSAHEVGPALRDYCVERRIPFLMLSRKKSIAATALEGLGYRQQLPLQPPTSPTPESNDMADLKKNHVPTTGTSPSKDEQLHARMHELKAIIRDLRDVHDVVSITFDKEAGLEIVRRQSIVDVVD